MTSQNIIALGICGGIVFASKKDGKLVTNGLEFEIKI